jgi:hypothetical protein
MVPKKRMLEFRGVKNTQKVTLIVPNKERRKERERKKEKKVSNDTTSDVM